MYSYSAGLCIISVCKYLLGEQARSLRYYFVTNEHDGIMRIVEFYRLYKPSGPNSTGDTKTGFAIVSRSMTVTLA